MILIYLSYQKSILLLETEEALYTMSLGGCYLVDLHSYKSDIWSLGVCLYYLLGRQLPFDGDNNAEVLTKILNENYNFDNKYWTLISQSAKHLISNIIHLDINKRYDLSQIIQHPWLKNVADD